ncbi:hypothetical protein [Leucobacter ruminantium]|uniref:Uncharacterized protein n=1 Tax=Leucobacter ruminantium TaxID=1289170 RepID=A0A939LVL3_9MICO|nr:hypothetical protein [Leucobacter ruminantium]MBO1803743.1 hypothetical protein [Leucobacter ruminantium]
MTPSPSGNARSAVAWLVLDVLLVLEALLLAWVLLIAVLATFGSGASVILVQNVSLIAMAALSLLWLVITLVGALRTRASWVRGSALTIHVLLFAAGTGCLQLGIGPWQFGFALVAAALAGFFAAILARPTLQEIPGEGSAAE